MVYIPQRHQELNPFDQEIAAFQTTDSKSDERRNYRCFSGSLFFVIDQGSKYSGGV
jgi:hypothetical protein